MYKNKNNQLNILIEAVVINYFKANQLVLHEGLYIIELLDYLTIPLSYEEVDLVYSFIETDNEDELTAAWFKETKAKYYSEQVQGLIASKIQQEVNVRILKQSKYAQNKLINDAILWFIGTNAIMSIDEQDIINTVKYFIEENYYA